MTTPLLSTLVSLALGLAALVAARLLLAYVARRTPEEPGTSLPAPGAALLVAAVTAAVVVLLWSGSLTPLSVVRGCWTAALAVIFAVDLRVRYILDIFTAPLALLAVFASIALSQPKLADAVGGAAIGLALFALFYALGVLVFRQPALGLGDVKLAGLLGLMVGATHILTAVFIGVFLGGLISLALITLKRAKMGDAPAYGTYLALGGYAALLQTAGVWR